MITTANPIDTSQLRLGKEVRRIKEEINKSSYRGDFEVISNDSNKSK